MKKMKNKFTLSHVIFCLLISLFLSGCTQKSENLDIQKVTPNSDSEYKWSYYLYIPAALKTNERKQKLSHILVVPNNTGKTDDRIEPHDRRALKEVRQLQDLADALETILLIPIFPRPQSHWKIYTHALDRDTLTNEIEGLRRIDLQLISMIDDARNNLTRTGNNIASKVIILGFSASGMFANRFTILHPSRVSAAVVGSPGGWPIVPVQQWENKALRYPVGIDDLQELVGKRFSLKEYQKVPQFLFMGANDENDSVKYNDGYDAVDRDLIYELFGKDLLPRWNNAKEIYMSVNAQAKFKIYENVGHDITPQMQADVLSFLKEVLSHSDRSE